jgi:hypothetical protein
MDGSEARELNESNAFDIQHLQTKLKLARAGRTDAYRQLGCSFVLLGECRDLLEITALESPLRKDIPRLIAKIDEFYPQAKGD